MGGAGLILEGTLRQFPLRELLDLMVYSSVTGALEVQSREGLGYVYTHMGQIYHATLGDQVGVPAVWALFEEPDAPFRFIAGQLADKQTIHSDVKTLADEGEERGRAWRALRPYVASLRLVPQLEPTTNGEHVRISEDDWPVMAAIDGTRNVYEIAAYIALDPLDVCRSLARLIEQQLVRLARPDQVARSTGLIKPLAGREHQPAAGEGGGTGLLSRLLASLPEEARAQQQAQVEPQQQSEKPSAPSSAPQYDPQEDEILRILRGT